MSRDIRNTDDIIDSRDVIERIEELQAARLDFEHDDAGNLIGAGPTWSEEHPDEFAELMALQALRDDAEGYADDWQYGETLIRESYFVEYCRELVSDIGDLPRELPSYIVIDWSATSQNLRVDYTEVDFDGVTYLVR